MVADDSVTLLGVKLPWFDKTNATHTVSLFSVFFVLMLVHDFLQEAIVVRLRAEGVSSVFLLTSADMLGCAGGALVFEGAGFARARRGGHLPWCALLTTVILMSVVLSNSSLAYVSYSTKVVAKSTKLIPSMLIAVFVLGRSYTFVDYACAGMLCLGLAAFTLGDSQSGGEVSAVGLLMLMGSCVCDALAPNLQERLMVGGPAPLRPADVMFVTNAGSFAVAFVVLVWSGDLYAVLALSDSMAVVLLVAMGMATYVAISTYMVLIKTYSGVAVVLVATLRKAVTVVLSFVVYAKAFHFYYALGGTLMLGGILGRKVIGQKKQKRDDDGPISEVVEPSGKGATSIV
jgi:adenosine 3'-phospho 5'-phosphosulfate transporter B3